MAAVVEYIPEFIPDITIRASSLATLFDCPERWAAQHPMLGNMYMPSGAASAIGQAVHAGTAIYDEARMIRIKPSLEDALEAASETILHPQYEIIWDDFNQREARNIAAQLVQNYCLTIAKRFVFDAIELPMNNLDITARNGLKIRFTGTIDRRRVEWHEVPGTDGKVVRIVRKGICDIKTGKLVVTADGLVNTKRSGAQMAQYELLELMATKTLGKSEQLPVMIFAFPTAGRQQPAVAEVRSPHRLMTGDAQHKGAIDIAADMIKSGNYWGNASSMLCNARYCPKHGNCRWQLLGETLNDPF